MERHEINFGPMTSLRFLAALHVVVLHESVDHIPGMPAWFNVLLDRSAAVSLFFFVSGFILSYSYAGKAFTPPRYRAFLVSRLARVYPLYLVGLVAWIPIYVGRDMVAGGTTVLEGLRTLGLNLFLLQAWVPAKEWFLNRPGWTLSTFLWFWLTLPPILAWMRRRRNGTLGALFVAFYVASQVLVWWFEAHYGIQGSRIEVLHKHPFVRWPEFLMGMTMGVLFFRGIGRHGVWQTRFLLPATGALALGLFVALPKPFDNYLHNGLLMPLLAVVLMTSLVTRHGTRDGLSSDWLVRQGRASFSLYIIHLPFANYLRMVWQGLAGGASPRFTLTFMVVDIALLMAIAPWVERHLESPWRERMKLRWRTSHTG